LNYDDWYVALHIRKTNYRFDERQVDQHKFNKALEAVIKAGGKVIQFGQNMTKVKLSDPNKIMYLDEIEATKNEETSLIAHSRFLLTTASGPIGVAHALGVPVLQTDSPAICMHSKTASLGTLYLPKKLIKNGKPVTYSELAETGLGYTHISLAEWRRRGIRVVENSSIEILEATLEMLHPKSVDVSLSKRLESLRVDFNVLARGTFANSYLEQNNWMLE
jgi:putative glycosyltransferase (TIGR04372 family)